MLKVFQATLQQYVHQEIPDVQAGFRKDWTTRDQIDNIRWIMEKAKEFPQKTSTSVLSTMLRPLTSGSQQTGKFLKGWAYQTTLPVSWKTCMWVNK